MRNAESKAPEMRRQKRVRDGALGILEKGSECVTDEFPKRLRVLRESRRPLRSMAVTSELIGLPSSAIGKYERGEADPTVDSLAAIADYYRVSMDYLWGRTNY